MLYRKFCLSLPFHRQSADYCNQGIDLSRQVMIRWANRIVTDVLTPVYNHMIACLMKQGYIHSDETIIHVNRDERTAGRKNYMWIHCSSELLDCSPIIIFSYEATRNTDHLRNMFGEFLGYMTCDAYVSYQVFESENEGVQTTGCWMHCRRYWANAFFLNDITRLSEDILLELPETRALFLIRDIYAVHVSANMAERASYLDKLSTDEYKQLTRKRNAIEGIPSVLRRKYHVDDIPVFGYLRSRQFFLFKVGAYNFNKLLKHNRRTRGESAQNPAMA